MKLSAILFVASATAQYDSNYDSNYNDSNYAPAGEYDPYGASEYAPYEAPAAEDERRGVQEPPSGARPGQQKSKLNFKLNLSLNHILKFKTQTKAIKT